MDHYRFEGCLYRFTPSYAIWESACSSKRAKYAKIRLDISVPVWHCLGQVWFQFGNSILSYQLTQRIHTRAEYHPGTVLLKLVMFNVYDRRLHRSLLQFDALDNSPGSLDCILPAKKDCWYKDNTPLLQYFAGSCRSRFLECPSPGLPGFPKTFSRFDLRPWLNHLGIFIRSRSANNCQIRWNFPY